MPREAVVEVDPRLRLLPVVAGGPISRVRSEEGLQTWYGLKWRNLS